jgi:hypothetical protein
MTIEEIFEKQDRKKREERPRIAAALDERNKTLSERQSLFDNAEFGEHFCNYRIGSHDRHPAEDSCFGSEDQAIEYIRNYQPGEDTNPLGLEETKK